MVLDPRDIELFKDIIRTCKGKLYRDDQSLLERLGMEWSLTFRFAMYLHEAIKELPGFNELNLDVEYNKNGIEPKRTPRRPNGVRPDVILHQRGNNYHNTLVIEIKGHWNPESRDIDRMKLEDFTHQDGEYKYGLGVFLELEEADCTPMYYINAQRMP